MIYIKAFNRAFWNFQQALKRHQLGEPDLELNITRRRFGEVEVVN
ncbi:MAG: hypothetical protein ACI9CE_003764 [Flavobacterium sp.]|jgi:hypothetical protein